METQENNFIKNIAIRYHQMFGFNLLPVAGKNPIIKWEKWQTELQTLIDIEQMEWNHSTTGIGGISGPNKLRFIDIDGIIDWRIIDIIVEKLKLVANYCWITISGSKKGAHIIFLAEDDEKLFLKLGGKKGVYKFKFKIEGYCHHIELRWAESQTVLPPSKHPNGSFYEFKNNEPTEKPSFIKTETLIEFAEGLLVLDKRQTIEKSKMNSIKDRKQNDKYDPKEIEVAIDVLAQNLNEDCYDEWMEIGFALASMGEEGRKYFLMLSLANNYYNDTEEVINKKFDGFLKDYNGRTTLGTLFFYAKKYGYESKREEKEKKADFFKQAEEYLNDNYDFNLNTLKQKLYWKRKDEKEFQEIKDRHLSSIFIELKSKEKINISYENLRRLLNSDFVPQFHPIEDYFKNLPEWDGTDYIEMLSETVKVEEGSKENWMICLRKWLIATVACALCDRDVNHTAIILQGPQGIGKSRWITSIVPEKLQDYLFTGNITPNDKDSKLAVVKNFIINLDELETLNRDEIGFLKSLMTLKDLEIRKPYGYFEEQYKRRSSFIGSINKLEFLNDLTGSRRFLCFAVEKVDYEHNINIDGVYAQALHLFNKKEKYWFDKAENDWITENNMKFTFQPLEEQLILEKYEPCSKDEPEKRLMAPNELAKELLGDKPFNNNTIRQIGMVMAKHGFIKGSEYNGKHSIKKWIVKKIKPESVI